MNQRCSAVHRHESPATGGVIPVAAGRPIVAADAHSLKEFAC